MFTIGKSEFCSLMLHTISAMQGDESYNFGNISNDQIWATNFFSHICFLLIFLPALLPIYSPFQYNQFLVNQSVWLVCNPTIPLPLLDGMVSHGSLSHQTWNHLCLNVHPHEQGRLDHIDPCLKIKTRWVRNDSKMLFIYPEAILLKGPKNLILYLKF